MAIIHLYLWLPMKPCMVGDVYILGWFQVGESSLLGPDLIYKTLEKVHIQGITCKWAIVGKSLMLIIG